uniref:Protein kinase domain-containing protein n=1 Tax=Populus alba TaxID=43335 RepID=A0A4U5R4G8_POPAL|nr:hypothetical protein D5086_0000003290 [Populus alba]
MCAKKEVRVISDDQNSNECLKQLNQEIALLSELSHPNIVQYYGSKLGVDNLPVYLEFVSGGSIHKLLSEYGSFSEPLIQNYTKQILSGLAYLHGRKTMHRDIKGANILVGPNREIMPADFGMARHVAAILKIAESKNYPEIPSHQSEDAQSFVKLCLLRDPSIRPPASQLLHHTFIENLKDRKNC